MAVLDNVARVREGLPHPLGATWDGRGQFRPVLGQRHKVEICLFDDPGQPRPHGSSCPNTPTRSGTAICPDVGPGRSTAIASTAPTSPTPAIASIPTSWCSIPMPAAHFGELKWDPAVFGYKIGIG